MKICGLHQVDNSIWCFLY